MTTTESHAERALSTSFKQASARVAGRAREWRFAAIVIALALLLSTAPYLFASLTARPDEQFMGLALNVPDHIQYFSWMRDLSTSNLAANRLTAEPNDPVFFNLLWWTLGHVGAATGLDYAALYSVLRVLATVVCLSSAYAFLRLAVPDLRQRRLAFVLIAFGSGLGIFWIAVKYLQRLPEAPYPFDTYTLEPNVFLSLIGGPHFALALGLLIAVFGLTLVALREKRQRYAIAAGVVALILGLQHAYDLITIYAVLGLFGLLVWIRDREFPRFLFVAGLIIVALSLPPAAYSLLLVKANPVWGEVLSQFDLAGAFTPNPLHLPILLGAPFLLALLAFRPRMLQSLSDMEMFVGAWFVTHFVLVYLPVDFQIHLLLGWQVPIAILATSIATTRIAPKLANRSWIGPKAAVAGVLAVSIVTNAYLLAWRFIDLNRHESPYYLSRSEIAGLDWLAAHATSSDVVLAELDFGQYVPTWSDARAFLAHWTGTLDYLDKQRMVASVLNATTPEGERRAILNEYEVSYVVVRDGGSVSGHDSAWIASTGWRAVFANDRVTIYRVQLPP